MTNAVILRFPDSRIEKVHLIPVIKALRTLFALGLKEAKDVWDHATDGSAGAAADYLEKVAGPSLRSKFSGVRGLIALEVAGQFTGDRFSSANEAIQVLQRSGISACLVQGATDEVFDSIEEGILSGKVMDVRFHIVHENLGDLLKYKLPPVQEKQETPKSSSARDQLVTLIQEAYDRKEYETAARLAIILLTNTI